jgi:hypothetical protein
LVEFEQPVLGAGEGLTVIVIRECYERLFMLLSNTRSKRVDGRRQYHGAIVTVSFIYLLFFFFEVVFVRHPRFSPAFVFCL